VRLVQTQEEHLRVQELDRAFREAWAETKRRLLEQKTGPRILNINCWNEWTEGSYLEPDVVHGMKYLEAVKSVFRGKEESGKVERGASAPHLGPRSFRSGALDLPGIRVSGDEFRSSHPLPESYPGTRV